MTDPRVPVTLLTGFLGAGKTTLLNAILAKTTAGPVAAIARYVGRAELQRSFDMLRAGQVSEVPSDDLAEVQG